MLFVFLRGGRKNRSHEIRKYKNAGGHKAAPLRVRNANAKNSAGAEFLIGNYQLSMISYQLSMISYQ
jgi:hypothetical protein